MRLFRKSIYLKMILGIILPLLIILGIAAVLVMRQIESSIISITSDELYSKSETAASQISEFFTYYQQVVSSMEHNQQIDRLIGSVMPGRDTRAADGYRAVMRTLDSILAADENISLVWLVDLQTGDTIRSGDVVRGLPDYDITARSWYGELMGNDTLFMTAPYLDSTTQDMVTSIMKPLYDSTGKKCGAVAIDLNINELGRMMGGYRLKDEGYFLLISESGMVIYHPDSARQTMDIGEIGVSPNIVEAVRGGLTGQMSYTMDGDGCHGALAQVGGTGWMVLSGLGDREFYAVYNTSIRQILLIFSVGLGVLLLLTLLMSYTIVRPMQRLAKSANQIADGDLSVQVDIRSIDETGKAAQAMQRTAARLNQYIAYIDEITGVLRQVAKGKLDFTLTHDYTGEFAKVKDALLEIRETLSMTIVQIETSARRVGDSAERLSGDSVALLGGVSEQSGTLGHLEQSVGEISVEVANTAGRSQQASGEAHRVAKLLEESNRRMDSMAVAMENIQSSSREIGNIIKTIEDIAFQTSILALNAAVESARAGESGKGFAVVADEVRNLANKSSKAAQSTAELIDRSIQSVAEGAEIASAASRSILDVVDGARNVAVTLETISADTKIQDQAVQRISEGIGQISQVVRRNAEAANSGVACSEELEHQAGVLYQLLSQFRLAYREDAVAEAPMGRVHPCPEEDGDMAQHA